MFCLSEIVVIIWEIFIIIIIIIKKKASTSQFFMSTENTSNHGSRGLPFYYLDILMMRLWNAFSLVLSCSQNHLASPARVLLSHAMLLQKWDFLGYMAFTSCGGYVSAISSTFLELSQIHDFVTLTFRTARRDGKLQQQQQQQQNLQTFALYLISLSLAAQSFHAGFLTLL